MIWRRLLVPGGVYLAKLHNMFRAAMGWTNSHLHSFPIGDQLHGKQFDDYPENELDEKAATGIYSHASPERLLRLVGAPRMILANAVKAARPVRATSQGDRPSASRSSRRSGG